MDQLTRPVPEAEEASEWFVLQRSELLEAFLDEPEALGALRAD